MVRVIADADVVDQAPGLADDVRTEDLTASGWTVDGPTPTSDGGLQVELHHPFANVAEANAIQNRRVEFYAVRAGDTWESIAAAGGNVVKPATLAIINGQAVSTAPRPGSRVRTVR